MPSLRIGALPAAATHTVLLLFEEEVAAALESRPFVVV